MIDIPNIPFPDIPAMEQAQQILTDLDISGGELGKLATLSIRLAGMTGRTRWFPVKRATLLFAGDHGIATQPDAGDLTAKRVQLALDQKSPVNSLSRQMGARVIVVDVGVSHQFKPRPRSLMPPIGAEMQTPTFIQRKVASGTNNFTQGTAMTAEQAQKAIQVGMDVVKEEQKRGIDLIFLGAIGTGQLTSAAAILTAIMGKSSSRDDAVIQQALTLHEPARDNLFMKLGGFEMGAIAGAILYAASQRIPMVLDGLACTAGALIAYQHNPAVSQFLIAGHKSDEAGHQQALGYLRLDPLLELGMSIGEGTGALLAFPLIESAMRLLNEVSKRDVG